jgi:hypothetical protein
MDERTINGAAIEAISALELDCEIKEVCKGAGKDEWCVQFSGQYGQLCDDFKNQFGKENSPRVIREKIKSHLLKQVSKLRSSTGRRRRRPAIADASQSRESAGDILTSPLKLVKEVFNRATGIAGEVVNQASTVVETARETIADAASNIVPLTIEVRSTTPARKKSAPRSSKSRAARAKKKTTAKAKKHAKRIARGAGKKGEKARKTATSRIPQKRRKTAKKTSRARR